MDLGRRPSGATAHVDRRPAGCWRVGRRTKRRLLDHARAMGRRLPVQQRLVVHRRRAGESVHVAIFRELQSRRRLVPDQRTGYHRQFIKSIRHAHGVLRTALAHAAAVELIERNVCTIIQAPKVVRTEVEILNAEQIADALRKLEGHPLYPIVALAIGTGARRGEIAALRWSDIDLDAATVRIERALEETKGATRMKLPKTAAGRRTISLPSFAVDALRDHRRQTLELRLKIGIGALPGDAPVFGDIEGNWPTPHGITKSWRRAVQSRGLPRITFHSLRHSHASALIAAGIDVVTVSRRLGHASPALTLSTYSHLFTNSDDKAAAAIDATLAK